MADARAPEVWLATPRTTRRSAGLRLQILFALGGLMVLAFVPLFFAVASLTRATVADARMQSARSIARAVAVDVAWGDAKHDRAGAGARAERHRVAQNAVAVVVRDAPTRAVLAVAGDANAARDVEGMTADEAHASGHGLVDVAAAHGDVVVAMRLHGEDAGDRAAPLVRLVAMYMTIFGIALLTFAYFALTRLIVRPLEHLAAATEKVAAGARTLRLPRAGARELIELGDGLQTMTTRLLAEEEELRAKVDELTTTKVQLVRSERMASVGRLAAGVAHEIGNPIAALMGMEDLLLDGVDADTQKDFLTRMKKETERINGVVRDLLDFARPERGAPMSEGGIELAANVADVAGDVAALVKTQKEFRRGVALHVDASDGLVVRLAAPRLTQVLLNLVLNAGAAVKADGHVVVRAKAADDRVVIEVEDDGPGIPDDMVESIFEPFVTTKDVGEGTGLGLSVCRGLVESAGGTIAVDASYRNGARIVIVLPRATS